jgi:hypothetical protein
VVTFCVKRTGVTRCCTQKRLKKSATPGHCALLVQRLAPAVGLCRLRTWTGKAAPAPSAVVSTGLSSGLALPVLTKSVLASQAMSSVRLAPALW